MSLPVDPSAPLYSKLDSREGFAHWTTSHLPPRKKLEGKKQAFSFSLPYGQFPEVNEPLPPPPRQNHRQKESKSQARREGHNAHGGGRRGPGGFRLGQKIVRLLKPLDMLRMVTVLFLNVTYNVTMETFSLPRHVLIVAKWLWPNATKAKGQERKRREGARGSGGHENGDESGGCKEEKGGPAKQLKARLQARVHGLQDGLKDLGKNSKKWSEALGRSANGMRRGFRSSENVNEQRRIDYLVKEGRRCDSVCDSSGAVNAFRAAVGVRPSDPDLLVCLAKSLSDKVFEHDIFHDQPRARAFCIEAAEISRKAIAIKPDHSEAHVCLGAALGRLSMWSDNREKVDLSGSIKDECEEAIRLNPENDLAMHVLGRYEHQMASLGRIVRMLVRVVYHGALAPGTLQEAENLFRRAIAIRPTRLIHRVELGKLLVDRGRKDEAKVELELAVTLPREDINSEHERRDAQAMLKKLWGREVELPTFEDPPPTPQPKLSRRSMDRSGNSLDGLDQLGRKA